MKPQQNAKNVHIIGGGIAGLSAAAYLLRDANINGSDIVLYDEGDVFGGCLDAAEMNKEGGYVMRGYRMFDEKVYSAMLDLLSFIPSEDNPKKTLLDDFHAFNEEVRTDAHARLVENGTIAPAKNLGLSMADRIKLLLLLARSERSLGTKRIDDYFSKAFFSSNFWYEYATTFSFQPWHSMAEFRRYMLRFLHDAPMLDTCCCIRNTRYNQFDSIVKPLVKWLSAHGVRFESHAIVTDVTLEERNEKTYVKELTFGEKNIPVSGEDLVFLTLGSMTAHSSPGSMHEAPSVRTQTNASWELWEKLARKNPEFGNPSRFQQNGDNAQWTSFTITFRDPLFFDLIEKITNRKAGSEGVLTIKDAPWLLTFSLPHQPHFQNQPKDAQVLWGYGLFGNEKGRFVQKSMHECTGEEILEELCKHLRFDEHLEKIKASAVCTPCVLPYITSQFFPRKEGDRPDVVPKHSGNYACIGQYCEVPKDIVFTVEYSVRSAQIAVQSLCKTKKIVSPMYNGRWNPKILFAAIRTIFR